MKTSYIVSVTYSEFMVWYASGELRLSRNRLIEVPLDESGKPTPDQLRVQKIMDLLPHVDLENEHSILIVQLDREIQDNHDGLPSKAGELRVRSTIYLPFRCIQKLFPLTQRGSDILKSRLDNYYVELNEPLFEKQASRLWEQRSNRNSLRGASALLSIIMANSDFESNDFKDIAFKALNLVNHQAKFPLNSHGLLANVFGYDRHDPVPDEDVGFVIDLGIILRRFFSSNDKVKTLIDQLRTFCKPKEHRQLSLSEIFSDSEFNNVVRDMGQFIPGKVHLESFILFLKWKYNSQRLGNLDIKKLIDDVCQCAEKIEENTIEQALWLFGYFWGFDGLAKEYYARQSSGFPFIMRKISHDPYVPPEVVIAKEPQEIEKSTQSTKKQEDSEMSASEEKLKDTDVSPAAPDDAKKSQKAEELAQSTDKKEAPERSASKEKSENAVGSPATVEEQEASEIAQDDQEKSQCEGKSTAVQAPLPLSSSS